jgi:S-adenosylmethionine synthetase
MTNRLIRTSECVSEGHPDKVADYLSDSVLDYYLKHDPDARVACETLVKSSTVVFAGEITAKTDVLHPDLKLIAKNTLNEIGFVDEFSLGNLQVVDLIGRQSPDIAMGVDSAQDGGMGAGDQGIMFGYACDETEDLLPLPYVLARDLLVNLRTMRRDSTWDGWFGPDAKSQVSVEYIDGKPTMVTDVVLSTQHSEKIHIDVVRDTVLKNVVEQTLSKYLTKQTKIYINPTGRFVIGGPIGDCGVTGRKIVVDSYGGFSPVGGGAFSGKDPSKVDRSSAYFARWIAAEAVRQGYAKEVKIELAYSIGIAHPLAINVSPLEVKWFVNKFDFRPDSIIRSLDLKQPFYKKSTNYGHFTDKSLPWNKPMGEDLLQYVRRK